MIVMTAQTDPHRDEVITQAQMDLASFEYGEQEGWIKDWTARVIVANQTNDALRRGQHLYMMLPKEFAREINGTLHDPFYSNMEKGEIIQWFQRHITFREEDGEMAILRDYEKALWGRQNWSE